MTRQNRLLGVLHNRDFTLLWAGLSLSDIGDWINYVAMAAVVFGETHSPIMLALLRLFHIIPILIIAPFAGVFVDRWPRKKTLVVTPLIAAVAAFGLALYHPVGAVFVGYGVLTVAGTFFNPTRAAIIPGIVADSELVSANSLLQITDTGSIVVGGLIGGLLISQVGPVVAFSVNGLSFLVIAGLALPVRVPHSRRVTATVREDLLDGLRHVRAQPLVATIVTAGGIFIFAPATVLTLGIAFVHSSLHAGANGYGVILAGMGVGSLLGAVIMIGVGRLLRGEFVFAASGLALGGGVVALGLSSTIPAAAAAYAVAGLATVANAVSAVTLLQRLVPDRLRGRVFAVASTFDHVGAFASTVLVGLAGGVVGAGELIALSGAIAVLTGLGVVALVMRRRLLVVPA